MFLAFHIVALVTSTIGPGFDTLAVLLILFPVSLVSCAIEVAVYAESMSFVILPIAIIDISVSMDESPLSVGFVFLPPPFIEGAIRPDLDATSLSDLSVNDPRDSSKKERPTILPDISLRSLVAPSLFDEVFCSNPAGILHSRILQVDLECSIIIVFKSLTNTSGLS